LDKEKIYLLGEKVLKSH